MEGIVMKAEEEPKVEEIQFDDQVQEESEEVLPLDKSKRVIVSQPSDERVAILHTDVMRGKLLLQPTCQRQYVWDRQKATSLIESALMGIPPQSVGRGLRPLMTPLSNTLSSIGLAEKRSLKMRG